MYDADATMALPEPH